MEFFSHCRILATHFFAALTSCQSWGLTVSVYRVILIVYLNSAYFLYLKNAAGE
jgi:hypothetical protein